MGQKKLERFAAIETFANVLQHPQHTPGTWAQWFAAPQPLTLELACGKGEYTVGMASYYPERNFLGVDIKGNRIFIGARRALQIPLPNAGFMRAQIDAIDQYFAPDEVESIWFTFPDPQLRKSKQKKRLTHPRFLRKYATFLAPGALLHLKTDSPVLYTFTKKVIELIGAPLVKDYTDVYAEAQEWALLHIKTHYEGLDIAQSGKIFYLCFSLPPAIPDIDETLKHWVFENELD